VHIETARDQELLAISERNEASLARQLNTTRERAESGLLPNTDIFQARSRFRDAEALTIERQTELAVTESVYFRFAGVPPADLQMPDVFDGLPASREETLQMVETSNPEILAANFAVKATDKSISVARSDLFPTVILRGRMERDYNDGANLRSDSSNDSLTLNVSIPLYESGVTQSNIRSQKIALNEALMELSVIRREVAQEAFANWKIFDTTRSVIEKRALAVEDARKTMTGYEREFKIGNRSTLDLLDSESDLLQAETALTEAQADYAIAALRLMATLGKFGGKLDTAHKKGFLQPVQEPAISLAALEHNTDFTSAQEYEEEMKRRHAEDKAQKEIVVWNEPEEGSRLPPANVSPQAQKAYDAWKAFLPKPPLPERKPSMLAHKPLDQELIQLSEAQED